VSGGPNVLDASAVLALLQGEPGADQVEMLLDGAVMSCVNLSEVLQKAEQHGADVEGLEHDLEALGVSFHGFDVPAARAAAEVWRPRTGLSLGDRACLGLAAQLGGVAVTAERRWTKARTGVQVRTIR
jgi:PIN domain nuclease of toxin-antitoxin system